MRSVKNIFGSLVHYDRTMTNYDHHSLDQASPIRFPKGPNLVRHAKQRANMFFWGDSFLRGCYFYYDFIIISSGVGNHTREHFSLEQKMITKPTFNYEISLEHILCKVSKQKVQQTQQTAVPFRFGHRTSIAIVKMLLFSNW